VKSSWLGKLLQEDSMTFAVPEPVAAYLAAEEAKDADALSRCFIEDGTVDDEGQDYRGRIAIRQ
jgi:hypothetical protein